ncbi:MAG: tungstate ABC transporter substrate-binding protein WtpA [Chloroflexota bacterium]
MLWRSRSNNRRPGGLPHWALSLALLAALLAACTSPPAAPGAAAPPAAGSQPAAQPLSAPAGAAETTAPAAPAQRTPLVVFCAGSLIVPFAELETAFEQAHPEIDVRNECHGSIQVIRHVTELHEAIDVVATADHALIPMLMYTAVEPQSGRPYAAWYLRFAANRLALAYGPHSRFAGELTAENWSEVIRRPGGSLGIADPRFDAAGYRALMALKLAEGLYDCPGIFKSVLGGKFRYPISAFEEDTIEISVPEIIEPLPGSGIVVRGASIQLIALLESGDLDYAFEYESVIRQHGLPYVALPDGINLGAPQQAAAYGRVTVKLDFQRFASVKPVFRGEPIGYGITIPVNAPHPAQAAQFIAFLLGPEGRRVMSAAYQPLIESPTCDGAAVMPAELASLCAK